MKLSAAEVQAGKVTFEITSSSAKMEHEFLVFKTDMTPDPRSATQHHDPTTGVADLNLDQLGTATPPGSDIRLPCLLSRLVPKSWHCYPSSSKCTQLGTIGRMNQPMRLMLAWICFAVLSSATAAVRADGSPDKAGKALAQDYCSACHRVSAEQAPPSKVTVDTGSGSEEYEAPSFRQVAAKPGRDADYLRTVIQAPHYPMREQLFIPEELEQIVTYILSLKADEGDW
jgi:mono/diheme cytochrome c family protein